MQISRKPFPSICHDCGIDTHSIKEYAYMVRNQLWPDSIKFLCIGCLENRLGRKLTSDDFKDVPFHTDLSFRKSERLRNRLFGEGTKMTNPQEMTNSEIESSLRSSLRLYTALWFATQTNQSLNLTFTTVLMRLIPTLQFVEELKRIAVPGR